MPEPSSPRLEPLGPDEWDDLLRGLIVTAPGGAERPLNIFSTLARHPGVFRRWLGFGGSLLSGTLPARQRELLILRVAHQCDGHYEWFQHLKLGAAAGVTPDEIEALRQPLQAGQWSEDEATLLQAADELVETHDLSDATWERAHRMLGDAGSIELLMLVGHYQMLATVLRALRVQIESDG